MPRQRRKSAHLSVLPSGDERSARTLNLGGARFQVQKSLSLVIATECCLDTNDAHRDNLVSFHF